MKKQKFFDQRLSAILLFSLLSLGIFPTLATASEDLNAKNENILTPSDQPLISETTENSEEIKVSDLISETSENTLNQNISTPETLNHSTFSENPNFNFEPISLEEALKYSSDETMAQVNNVNQLRDVSPTDWAYQALRNLV